MTLARRSFSFDRPWKLRVAGTFTVTFAVTFLLMIASLARAQEAEPSTGPQAPTGWSFNPLNVKRDPFIPTSLKSSELKSELERYDLNQMKLVAIMTGMGAAQAMLVLPDNKTYIVQENDVLGRRNGKIVKISTHEVVVKEFFRDFQNREKTDVTTLVLAE